MFRILLKILARLVVPTLFFCILSILAAHTQKPHDWLAFTQETNQGMIRLYLMDTTRSDRPTQRLKLDFPISGEQLAWSNDGRLAISVGERTHVVSEILIFDTNTTSFIDPVPNQQGREFDPTWSNDGRLAFSGKYDDAGFANLYLFDPAQDSVQQITTNEDGGGEYPAWSPDDQLAYVLSDRNTPDVAIYNLTKGTRQLLNLETESPPMFPAWSPAGLLAFQIFAGVDGGYSSLWLFDGTSPTFVEPIRYSGKLDWSTAGQVAYQSMMDLDFNDDIRVYTASNQTFIELREVTSGSFWPTWNPNDDLIFAKLVGSQLDIVQLDLETGAVTNLTNSPQNEYFAAWMP